MIHELRVALLGVSAYHAVTAEPLMGVGLFARYRAFLWSDEVDRQETIQEKTALSDRFGLRIPYLALFKGEFLDLIEQMGGGHRPGRATPQGRPVRHASPREDPSGGRSSLSPVSKSPEMRAGPYKNFQIKAVRAYGAAILGRY